MRASPRFLTACLCSLSVTSLLAGAAPAGEPAAAAEPGTWQRHEFSFEFMGFTSTYSCDGLADKLQRLLVLSGARADAKARPGACANGFGRPDRFARATLVFYTLAPGAGEGEPGSGRWRPVTLGIRTPNDLLAGDCELVEQFRDSVLKKMFTIRNLDDHTTCIPHQESGSAFNLRFETFEAAPGSVAPLPPPSPQVYAYPKQGQTAAQQAKDRAECEASAGAQSSPDQAAPRAKALAACLEARGYSVR
jgi:hypothetical protein